MAAAGRSKTFRRSPHLVGFWRGRAFFVHNYATGRERLASAATAQQLDFFSIWRSEREFADAFGVSIREGRRLIAAMLDGTMLDRSDRPLSARTQAMNQWGPWNPAAGFFHSATRSVHLLEPFESLRVMRKRLEVQRVPARMKRYPGARTWRLPRVDASAALPSVMLERRTWRNFSTTPIAMRTMGALLGLTGGVTHWVHAKRQPDLALKTSPSGGALHPIELYVWARKVRGLPAGLYHYAGDRHVLELVRRQRRETTVERYIPSQFWYDDAAAVVFFSAVYERYQWKYTEARAYRAILIEAGHQCQTFCLAATWLGLAPFCTMAFSGTDIEADLGLDGISESIVYAAGVGERPADARFAATPQGFPRIRTRRNRRVFEWPR